MKLYVGNIKEGTREEELSNLFSQVGDLVSVKIIKDRYSGNSRGFGFIEYENRKDGHSAITKLDGYSLKGSAIKVNEAKERSNSRSDRSHRR